MVKWLFVAFFICQIAFCSDLDAHLKDLLGNDTYTKYQEKLSDLFADEKSFFNKNSYCNYERVIEKLNQEMIFDLSNSSQTNIKLHFHSDDYPFLMIKIVSSILENLGYLYFKIDDFKINDNEITLNISLNSLTIPSPSNIYTELTKSNAYIVNIKRKSSHEYFYNLDLSRAVLNTIKLKKSNIYKGKISYLYNIQNLSTLQIESNKNNTWHPFVTFFGKNLNIISQMKSNTPKQKVKLAVPGAAYYLKVSDTYTDENLKHGFKINTK